MVYASVILVFLFYLICGGIVCFGVKILFDIRQALRRIAAALERQLPASSTNDAQAPGNKT
jgi:hypothetical protein